MSHEATFDEDALRVARELGRQDAEIFDARLRQTEAQEREKRITEVSWRPGVHHGKSIKQTNHQVAQLESQLAELSAYVRAVQDSGAWRFIQWARSLFGRQW